MTKAIESGMAKLRIEEAATKKQARVDTMEDVVVGVNKYRREEEDQLNVLSIDNDTVREQQIIRIKESKANRDEAKVKASLQKLSTSARLTEPTGPGLNDNNLLKVAVEAAKIEPH